MTQRAHCHIHLFVFAVDETPCPAARVPYLGLHDLQMPHLPTPLIVAVVNPHRAILAVKTGSTARCKRYPRPWLQGGGGESSEGGVSSTGADTASASGMGIRGGSGRQRSKQRGTGSVGSSSAGA
jgi:hypothetical protein